MLTREQILGASDRKTVPVDVPEWGGQVFVRTLSGSERDALEYSITRAAESGALGKNARARFAAAFLSDEAGNALFTPEDADALGAKSSAVLERIWKAGQKLNALLDTDVDALAKNSTPDLSASSTSP